MARAACALQVVPIEPEVWALGYGDDVVYLNSYVPRAVGLDLTEWIVSQLSRPKPAPLPVVYLSATLGSVCRMNGTTSAVH